MHVLTVSFAVYYRVKKKANWAGSPSKALCVSDPLLINNPLHNKVIPLTLSVVRRSEKKVVVEGPDEKELKKREKQRLEKEKKELKEKQEREKKEQKEKEKRENEMKKKFNVSDVILIEEKEKKRYESE